MRVNKWTEVEDKNAMDWAFDGIPVEEIASRLGRSVNATKTRLREGGFRFVHPLHKPEDFCAMDSRAEYEMKRASDSFLTALIAAAGGQKPWIPAKAIVSDCRGSAN